jgi:hypothetical protein
MDDNMLDDVSDIAAYYNDDPGKEHTRLDHQQLENDLPRSGFRGYFVEVSEIAPLHEMVGFETLVLAGVEPAISADDESYNQLQGKQRQLWFDMLYEISTDETLIGSSRHLLFIGKKG